jgi:hypothetical protein
VARQLVVIVGAGASWDCADPDKRLPFEFRPPVVRELFDRTYQQVLDRYPITLDVAADLRPLLADPSPDAPALKLEDYLRDRLRDSPHLHRRTQYWSVPLYLQELLLQCSQNYTTQPDNFNRLVSALLDLERVTFVTLNYDTILDRVLESYHAFDSELDYVGNPQFALIKLHGSVNWGRRVFIEDMDHDPRSDRYRTLCRELALDPGRIQSDVKVLAPPGADASVHELRSSGDQFFYPALSAPLGPDDDPTCPDLHLKALKTALSQEEYGYGLHVLVVGYSCLDKTPLDYIRDSGNRIMSLWIANGSEEASRAAYERMLEYMPSVVPDPGLRPDTDRLDLMGAGFSWVATPGFLDHLVSHVTNA